jgi:pimeloyl-ACP methyl ester carboxylesterase
MAHVTIEGVEIEYRLIPGDPERPWLVFLHEGLGSVSLWRDFPDKLARRLRMRALIYSRRGYGRSAPLARARDVTFMHEEARRDLPALLASFGIENPVLVGHSDGASIAIIRAADAAAETRACVLMAAHVFVESETVTSIARAVEAYEKTDLRARLARHHAHVDDAFLGWSRIWLSPQFLAWSLAQDVGRLSVPSLIIQGSDDEYGTLAQVDAICDAAPGPVQRLVLDHCGHAPHRDQEGAVLDAISGFVERVLVDL